MHVDVFVLMRDNKVQAVGRSKEFVSVYPPRGTTFVPAGERMWKSSDGWCIQQVSLTDMAGSIGSIRDELEYHRKRSKELTELEEYVKRHLPRLHDEEAGVVSQVIQLMDTLRRALPLMFNLFMNHIVQPTVRTLYAAGLDIPSGRWVTESD